LHKKFDGDDETFEFDETKLVETPMTVKMVMRKLIDKAILLSLARSKQVLSGYPGVNILHQFKSSTKDDEKH
jgi:hypothetical protein